MQSANVTRSVVSVGPFVSTLNQLSLDLDFFHMCVRSPSGEVYTAIRMGPSIEPCGTPGVHGTRDDLCSSHNVMQSDSSIAVVRQRKIANYILADC